MHIIKFDTAEALAVYSANKLTAAVRAKPDSLCCFAAGHTQNDTYRYFVQAVREQDIPVDRLRFIGLDEWGSLDGTDSGSCRSYIDERLLRPLGIREEQILLFFDGKSDYQEQCSRADRLLDEHGPIDILVLGIGVNGHVGFNEPGALPEERSHYLTLSETTTTVGKKYFTDNKQLADGITLGLFDLLKAEMILIQATGDKKSPVVSRIISGADPLDIPASWFDRADAELIVDSDALAGCHYSVS